MSKVTTGLRRDAPAYAGFPKFVTDKPRDRLRKPMNRKRYNSYVGETKSRIVRCRKEVEPEYSKIFIFSASRFVDCTTKANEKQTQPQYIIKLW